MAIVSHQTDVTIIGSGPVGLFAIFECGMMKMHCHVIDTLAVPGGQCSVLYPEKPIYDIPAYPVIKGQELVDNLLTQVKPFNPTYHFNQRVEKIVRNNERFLVTTSANTVIDTRIIIIAAGVGAFGPNRPPLDDIESYEDKSIFYYVKCREAFRDKRIVIAGGGDSAIDWALNLCEVARQITIIHRRAKFRAAPHSIEQLHDKARQGKIEVIYPYQLHALEGKHGQLSAIIVESLDQQQKRIAADILLPFFGLSMNLGPIRDWGLNIEKNHITVDQETMQSNIEGIFAIGDIASYPHKLKLILTGFAEAAQAAHTARNLVYPNEIWHFEYSTTHGVTSKQS